MSIMTGENMGVEKYGGINLRPPIFPGHNFTCDFHFFSKIEPSVAVCVIWHVFLNK